jgi:hypothetical protein
MSRSAWFESLPVAVISVLACFASAVGLAFHG